MSRKWKHFLGLVATLLAWSAVFLLHGHYHVTALTGQCCGYEGDPGFLWVFFLIWPGLLYFVVLGLILTVDLISWSRFGDADRESTSDLSE